MCLRRICVENQRRQVWQLPAYRNNSAIILLKSYIFDFFFFSSLISHGQVEVEKDHRHSDSVLNTEKPMVCIQL